MAVLLNLVDGWGQGAVFLYYLSCVGLGEALHLNDGVEDHAVLVQIGHLAGLNGRSRLRLLSLLTNCLLLHNHWKQHSYWGDVLGSFWIALSYNKLGIEVETHSVQLYKFLFYFPACLFLIDAQNHQLLLGVVFSDAFDLAPNILGVLQMKVHV